MTRASRCSVSAKPLFVVWPATSPRRLPERKLAKTGSACCIEPMKSPVAITLIIVGGLVVIAPIISDHLQRGQVVAALGKPEVTRVNLEPTPSADYRLGCYLLGSLMIAAAVVFSRRRGSLKEPGE